CVQAGLPRSDAFDNATQEWVGFYRDTQNDGERCDVARGYLHPALVRPNLTVITDARVSRLLLDGKRVIGSEYTRKGRAQRVEAGETVLCGGAINAPQVLLLSGIGPREEQARHDIQVRHALPGVGENLQDHPDALLVHRSLKK